MEPLTPEEDRRLWAEAMPPEEGRALYRRLPVQEGLWTAPLPQYLPTPEQTEEEALLQARVAEILWKRNPRPSPDQEPQPSWIDHPGLIQESEPLEWAEPENIRSNQETMHSLTNGNNISIPTGLPQELILRRSELKTLEQTGEPLTEKDLDDLRKKVRKLTIIEDI